MNNYKPINKTMDLYCLTDKNKYEVNIPQGSGEFYSTCPICSQNRKPQNQKKKCLSWNRNKELGHCHHCDADFVKYRELESQSDNSHKLPPPKLKSQPQTPKTIHTLSSIYASSSLNIESNFGKYLKKHFTKEEIDEVMKLYFLGRTRNKEVIYWYIDINSFFRSGKIIDYNPNTGLRVKDNGMMGKPDVKWVHTILKNQNNLPEDWTFSRCLFGEHLLKNNPKSTVMLVEGEKTAIIGSIKMPNCIWLATGGKGMFTEEECKCLRGRNVIIFPDLGATKEWSEKAEEISKAVGCKMVINDVLEKVATEDQREKGLDIADFLMQQKASETQKENTKTKKEFAQTKS